MKIHLLKPWGQYSKGRVFTDMPAGSARTLIDRGIAEEVKGEIENVAMTAPVDRSMRQKLKLTRR
ncbi:MAG TPA: hypothetical protein VND94_00970 [Terriglobia bacterium]|nr:hypothetical protein [Terriglobia bacterium]